MEFEVASVAPDIESSAAIEPDTVSPAAIERALIVAMICALVSLTALWVRHDVMTLIHAVEIALHNATPHN